MEKYIKNIQAHPNILTFSFAMSLIVHINIINNTYRQKKRIDKSITDLSILLITVGLYRLPQVALK